MTFKQGPNVNFETCKRFAGHDFLFMVFIFGSPRTNNKGDIRLFFRMMTPLDLEAGVKVKFDTPKGFAGNEFL